MSWKEVSAMSLREEFVALASVEGAVMSELCLRFEVSRKTGYKWLKRFQEKGVEGLQDRSRRPDLSPSRTGDEMEQRIVDLRTQHPHWGGRKLRALLLPPSIDEVTKMAVPQRPKAGGILIPSASTITAILRRHELLNEADGAGQPRAFQRFEREAPNELWQMDFKGHFAMNNGKRCHALTVLDDHSRFALCLEACGDECTETVQGVLTKVFKTYGIPRSMLMDNGSPWGDEGGQPWTRFTAWLARLEIGVSHGRPRHPQTQGKVERWHKTLNVELLRENLYADLSECAAAFEPWRMKYNTQRPHEALGMLVPAARYRLSERAFPKELPPIEYAPDMQIRKVQCKGVVCFEGRVVRVGKAFIGDPIGLRATTKDGVYAIHYCTQLVGEVDLQKHPKGKSVIPLDRPTQR